MTVVAASFAPLAPTAGEHHMLRVCPRISATSIVYHRSMRVSILSSSTIIENDTPANISSSPSQHDFMPQFRKRTTRLLVESRFTVDFEMSVFTLHVNTLNEIWLWILTSYSDISWMFGTSSSYLTSDTCWKTGRYQTSPAVSSSAPVLISIPPWLYHLWR